MWVARQYNLYVFTVFNKLAEFSFNIHMATDFGPTVAVTFSMGCICLLQIKIKI